MTDGSLNQAQRSAVGTLTGPLLVLAGAGTGKTRVVTHRVVRLIKAGVLPSRILAVTFTNKAAGEMRGRLRGMLKRKWKRVESPTVSTFHAHCLQILRRHITLLRYPARFRICDRREQEEVAQRVLRELKVHGATLRPRDLLPWISSWKMRGIKPQRASAQAESDLEHLAASAYRRYQRSLKTRGTVDFDDMLLLADEIFRRFPEARREEAGRFDHLLIDEYQDTNASQYRIAKALAAGHRNLCVVGDDDQAIYGWRGAEVAHILHFARDWPGAKVVFLEQNYRSTGQILQMANRLIACNATRHGKLLRAARPPGQRPRILSFRDPEDEAHSVVADLTRLLSKGDIRPRDLAILFRTNEQPRPFETELRQAKVPYVLIGGMSFYDRAEIRDLLAYLQLLDDPSDESALLRVVNTPPRGIGPRAVEHLQRDAVERGRPMWDVMKTVDRRTDLPAASIAAIGRFQETIERFRRQLSGTSVGRVARQLVDAIGYFDEIARVHTEPLKRHARAALVDSFLQTIDAYEKDARTPSLRGFLDETSLGGRQEENEKDVKLARDAVVLMTLHSAKGLEFPIVYLVGLEESILPHQRSLEMGPQAVDEERRLCYVGVTRAQEQLTLTFCKTRKKWGKRRATQPSRFLYELTGQAEQAPTAG